MRRKSGTVRVLTINNISDLRVLGTDTRVTRLRRPSFAYFVLK